VDQDCSRVISTLFAVLIRMLDLDLAYARITDPGDESPSEWMRSADSIDQHTKAREELHLLAVAITVAEV
jgi:hypothetical protein